MRRQAAIIGMLSGVSMLAGCGGGDGPQTVSAAAVTATKDPGTFVNPTTAKTYNGVGGVQSLDYTTDARGCCGQQALTYAGSQSTVRSSTVSITYDPTSAIFTLKVADPNGNVSTDTKFQDPGSRTDFNTPGSNVQGLEPQWGTPHLANPNIRYLQAGDGDPLSPYRSSGSGFIDPGTNTVAPDGSSGSSVTATSFFYEVPGSSTKYVTFAGFIRNTVSFSDVSDGTSASFRQDKFHIERGAFAYGEQTSNSAVPTTGTGSYSGNMLATMVVNPTLDGENGAVLSNYFQWIEGTSKVDVDFAKSTVNVGLAGTVSAGQFDRFSGPQVTTVPAGASFSATGSGRIDLVGSGGFLGSFSAASFGATTNGASKDVNIAGSSFNGAFYGPKAEEVGGGFRIVGGNPDERVDILGAFTGKH